MPPKKTIASRKKYKKPITTQLPSNLDEQVEGTIFDFSRLPAEVLLRISFYSHTPGDERWIDKSDLISINGVNRAFSAAVKEHLFRFMTLKYTYDYDRTTEQWAVPKLIRMANEAPSLFEAVKKYMKAIRLLILPIPDSTAHDIERGSEETIFSNWARYLRDRTQGTSHTQPWTASALSDFERYFGRDEDANGGPAQENLVFRGADVRREVFISYISRTMRRLVLDLSNLKHIEAGKVPQDYRWRFTARAYYETIESNSSTFPTAIMLKHKPATVDSVRIHSLPFQAGHQDAQCWSIDYTWFCNAELHRRLVQHGQHVHQLDIDVCFYQSDFFNRFKPWPSTTAYYSALLRQLPKLTFLRLTKICVDTVKDDDRMGHFLDSLFSGINLPELETIVLDGWSMAPNKLLPIRNRFTALTNLKLESFTMVSDDEDAASLTLQQLARSYNGQLLISMDDVVHRDRRRRVLQSWKTGLIGSV